MKRCRTKLIEVHKTSEKELAELEAEAEKEIQEAVTFALESPWPDPKNALEHVYASYQVEDWK